jgi:hypothetical protein
MKPNTNWAVALKVIVDQGGSPPHRQKHSDAITTLVNDRVIEVIPRTLHEHNEIIARRHVPRDPRTGRR